MTITAFHGSQIEKDAILAQLEAHRLADELVQGTGWENGKGCAIGCTFHAYDHALMDALLGPGGQMLARLEDAIFEGLPNDQAMLWPMRFMGAIRPGADISRVGWQFLHWLITDETANPGINDPLVRDAVRQCADVLEPLTRGEPADKSAASAAWSARSAAESARIARSARIAAWSRMADKLVELAAAA